ELLLRAAQVLLLLALALHLGALLLGGAALILVALLLLVALLVGAGARGVAVALRQHAAPLRVLAVLLELVLRPVDGLVRLALALLAPLLLRGEALALDAQRFALALVVEVSPAAAERHRAEDGDAHHPAEGRGAGRGDGIARRRLNVRRPGAHFVAAARKRA